jgi:CTP-dependent riboflavin kinase
VTRISNKQRIVLEDILASEATAYNGKPIPLYIEHILAEVQFSWNSEAERQRWLENLEARDLLRIEKGHFLRLTDRGRKALEVGGPAKRRDFQAEERARQKEVGIADDEQPAGWPFSAASEL